MKKKVSKKKKDNAILICAHKGCRRKAVTFHGVGVKTHGYCMMHRCCGNCGRPILECFSGKGCVKPTERQDYLNYIKERTEKKEADLQLKLDKINKQLDKIKKGTCIKHALQRLNNSNIFELRLKLVDLSGTTFVSTGDNEFSTDILPPPPPEPQAKIQILKECEDGTENETEINWKFLAYTVAGCLLAAGFIYLFSFFYNSSGLK